MKKLILLLVLVSGTLYAQRTPQQIAKQFNALVNVEDEERFYNDLLAKKTGWCR
ncbi:hypothetical protein [Pedobacter cryoconitis]|uniref:hypothetical protein n=1 Tax=Pedobacter cryoconitis TaxID=188932 RepID=UPI0012FC3AA9|nr:hypothetical protein [Pedobacter cryoconitis]